MKKSKFRAVLALLITLTLIIGILPMAVLAENDQSDVQSSEAAIEESFEAVDTEAAEQAAEDDSSQVLSINSGAVDVETEESEETYDSYFNGIGYNNGHAGDQDVAVMVYGEQIMEALFSSNSDINTFFNMLGDVIKGWVLGEKLPTVELYLVNEETHEQYKLTNAAVSRASFIGSFKIKTGGTFGGSIADKFIEWTLEAYDWVLQWSETHGELYKIYGATNVPQGDYTLQVRGFSDAGYTLSEPSSGSVKVNVGDNTVNYVGSEHCLGTWSAEIWGWTAASATVYMPGIFLKTNEPSFRFRSVDMGGNALGGTNFLLINRDELVNMTNAMITLGKDTFTNAVNLAGTDSYTWDELNILNKQLIKWDSDENQITMNYYQIYKLLTTYWSLMAEAAEDPVGNLLSDETDLRIPAILYATADENGCVTFTRDNNVTLKWSMQILLDMAGFGLDELYTHDYLDGMFENPMIDSIINLAISFGKDLVNDTSSSLENGDYDEMINFVYSFLASDNVASQAGSWIETLGGFVLSDETMETVKTAIQYLPTHGILTDRMPTGNYIMLETTTPEGYIRSPLCYSIDMEWYQNTENLILSCYATVGDVGIVLPYFAEDYYTYLREFDLADKADELISKITNGSTEDLIKSALTNETDLSAATIAYMSNLIYGNLGGDNIYESEEALSQDLTKYLYSHGRTLQNLMIFADSVLQAEKNVITSEINESWNFYTFSTSIRTNKALKLQAVIRNIADSMDDSQGNIAETTTKEVLNAVADNIDTSNWIEKAVPGIKGKITTKIKDTVKSTVSDIISKVVENVKNPDSNAITKAISNWITKVKEDIAKGQTAEE